MKRIILIILSVVGTIVFVALAFFAVVYLLIGGGSLPSEKTMINHYYKHQLDFAVVANASAIDQEQYQKALREIGVKGSVFVSKDGSIRITTGSIGLAVSGAEKGYAFFPASPPNPVVSSIDKEKSSAKSLAPIYRNIEGNWYVYYMFDD